MLITSSKQYSKKYYVHNRIDFPRKLEAIETIPDNSYFVFANVTLVYNTLKSLI